jgi:hypothetical protein
LILIFQLQYYEQSIFGFFKDNKPQTECDQLNSVLETKMDTKKLPIPARELKIFKTPALKVFLQFCVGAIVLKLLV